MVSKVLIKRTSTPNQAPAALDPGELAVEMADPTRLWVGVPAALGVAGNKKLLFESGAAAGAFVLKAGDTMTGALHLPATLPTAPDEATNKAYVDTHLTQAKADPLYVNVTGDTMTGQLKLSMPTPSFVLERTNPATVNMIIGANGALREWTLALGNGAGGDLTIARHDNAGAHLDFPFNIQRSDGMCYVTHKFGFGNSSAPVSHILQNGGSTNHGSDMTGTVGVYLVNSGSAWAGFSDARLPWKVNAPPVDNVLDLVSGVQLYRNLATNSGRVELFVKAQELATVLPELVHEPEGPQARDANFVPELMGDENSWGVFYDRAGVVALQAIKELLARVEALEAQLAAR